MTAHAAATSGPGPPRPGWLAVGGLPLVLFLLFVGLPFAALFIRGVGQEGFWGAMGEGTVLSALRVSFVTSAITVAVTAVAGTPLAYLLARSRSRWKGLIDSLIELPIVLPPIVAGLSMLMAFGREGIIGGALESVGVSLPFTMTAVVFAQLFVGAPFYIRSARIGFEGVDPGLEDIAATLGAAPAKVFLRVSLPMASRALVAGMVLCWTRAISEFGATIMFAGNLPGKTQTMPLAILAALETDIASALALAAVLAVISLAVLAAVRLAFRRSWVFGS